MYNVYVGGKKTIYEQKKNFRVMLESVFNKDVLAGQASSPAPQATSNVPLTSSAPTLPPNASSAPTSTTTVPNAAGKCPSY